MLGITFWGFPRTICGECGKIVANPKNCQLCNIIICEDCSFNYERGGKTFRICKTQKFELWKNQNRISLKSILNIKFIEINNLEKQLELVKIETPKTEYNLFWSLLIILNFQILSEKMDFNDFLLCFKKLSSNNYQLFELPIIDGNKYLNNRENQIFSIFSRKFLYKKKFNKIIIINDIEKENPIKSDGIYFLKEGKYFSPLIPLKKFNEINEINEKNSLHKFLEKIK